MALGVRILGSSGSSNGAMSPSVPATRPSCACATGKFGTFSPLSAAITSLSTSTEEIPSAIVWSKVSKSTLPAGPCSSNARISGARERSNGRLSSSAAAASHDDSGLRRTVKSIGATVGAR